MATLPVFDQYHLFSGKIRDFGCLSFAYDTSEIGLIRTTDLQGRNQHIAHLQENPDFEPVLSRVTHLKFELIPTSHTREGLMECNLTVIFRLVVSCCW
jgi:hypothetical protein